MGLSVGLFAGGSDSVTSACAIIGMGSLFSSVLHLPVSGVIIVFELTQADMLVLHVVVANFLAANVAMRLPGGEHSFVHLNLHKSEIWRKLGGQDFIETDHHENAADTTIGIKKVHAMKCSALKDFLMTDSQRLRGAFRNWAEIVEGIKRASAEDVEVVVDSWDGPFMKKLFLFKVWGVWRNEVFRNMRGGDEAQALVTVDSHSPWPRTRKQSPLTQGDEGLRPSFACDVFLDDMPPVISLKNGRQVAMIGDQDLRPSFFENVSTDDSTDPRQYR